MNDLIQGVSNPFIEAFAAGLSSRGNLSMNAGRNAQGQQQTANAFPVACRSVSEDHAVLAHFCLRILARPGSKTVKLFARLEPCSATKTLTAFPSSKRMLAGKRISTTPLITSP